MFFLIYIYNYTTKKTCQKTVERNFNQYLNAFNPHITKGRMMTEHNENWRSALQDDVVEFMETEIQEEKRIEYRRMFFSKWLQLLS
jgi:tRNA splicing ligase